MTVKILPRDQKEKPEHRESSRLKSQPLKNYKTLIPQSEISNFKNNFNFNSHFHLLFNHFEHTQFQNNMLKNT